MPRKTNTKKPNKTVLLVVEGETEEMYFRDIKAKGRFIGVTVKPIKAKHSDAKAIINEGIKNVSKSKGSQVYSSVWCVFDGDTIVNGTEKFQQDVIKLQQKAKENGVKLARSTPSFEVWFLLHYAIPQRYYPSQDKVIDALKEYVPSYTKETRWKDRLSFHDELREKLNNAIGNAEKLAKKYIADTADMKITRCDVYKIFDCLTGVSAT